jgi:hypothetical protein
MYSFTAKDTKGGKSFSAKDAKEERKLKRRDAEAAEEKHLDKYNREVDAAPGNTQGIARTASLPSIRAKNGTGTLVDGDLLVCRVSPRRNDECGDHHC